MIRHLSSKIPVRFLCKYFSTGVSSYYYWLNGKQTQRLQVKSIICKEITAIFKISDETYGSPRMYRELKSLGYKISKNTVAKYMKELGLDARFKKTFKVKTTDSNHSGPIAPRLFVAEEESCLPSSPHQILAGDITYLRAGNEFIYLAVVIDLYNREVIGWSMRDNLETGVVLNALDMAMKKVGPDVEIIFHSDRGSQYASEAYRNFMKMKNITASMSRKGNCYDNVYVESWFASLKKDKIYRHKYSTKAELRAAVFEYIETWYNSKRRHSSLGYLSPIDYKNINITA